MNRLLILGLNFYPEPISTGKYTGELACYLSQQGFSVRVITTPPYYPHWRVAEGYHAGKYIKEKWGKIKIWRCPLWVPRRPNGLKRLVHLASFAFSSVPILLQQKRWGPDLIICVAPTLLNAPGALLLAGLCRAKTWLHIQDFELEAAIKLNMLPGLRWLVGLAGFFERHLLKSFDRISTISNRMMERLAAKGVPTEKCLLLPNWVDTGQIYPLAGKNSFRAELNLPENIIVALYSGNMGYKQGLDTVIEAARMLQDHPGIIFILCGDGAARDELLQKASGLPNLIFLTVQPAEKLNQLLNLADIHLLPQKADAADLVMPSKLGGMLASGKVVIASAKADTEVGQVVNQTGILVSPEDVESLKNAILKLAQSPHQRKRMGLLGRKYVQAHWESSQILENFRLNIEKFF